MRKGLKRKIFTRDKTNPFSNKAKLIIIGK
jgi:hypothetical protein